MTATGNIFTSVGNLIIGDGTPGVTQSGGDAYITGTLEVDGASTVSDLTVEESLTTPNEAANAYYIVYTTNGVDYVKTGSDGSIAYSNTGSDDVAMQWAVDNLPNTATVYSSRVVSHGKASVTEYRFILPRVKDSVEVMIDFTEGAVAYSVADVNGDGDCDQTPTSPIGTDGSSGGGTAQITSCTIDYITGGVILTVPDALDANEPIRASYTTRGREQKYKVSAGSDLIYAAAVTVPSMTSIDHNGFSVTASGVFTGVGIYVEEDDTGCRTASNCNASGLEFTNASLYGDLENHPADLSGIMLTGTSDVVIKNIIAYNIWNYGFDFIGSSNVRMHNVSGFGNGDDCISIREFSYNFLIEGGECGYGQSYTGNSAGVEVEDGAHDVLVKGYISHHNKYGAVVIIDDTAGVDKTEPYNVIFDGIIAYDNEINFYFLGRTNRTDDARNIQLINSIGYNAVVLNVNAVYTEQLMIKNNTFVGYASCQEPNLTLGTCYKMRGIFIQDSDEASITGNQILNHRGVGILLLEDIDTVYVNNNEIFNNGQQGTGGQLWGVHVQNDTVDNISIKDNFIGDTQAVKTQEGIYIQEASNNLQIVGNDLLRVKTDANALLFTLAALPTNTYVNNNRLPSGWFRFCASCDLRYVNLKVDDDVTPDVSRSNRAGKYILRLDDNTNPNALINLDNAPIGEYVTLIGAACPTNCTTISTGANFTLTGTSPWTSSENGSITFVIRNTTDFLEVNRYP